MSVEPYRVVSVLPQGTAVSRFIIAKALGRGDMYTEIHIAERWRDTPQVKASLELQTKAAVPAGSTTDATWAGPLSVHGVAQEAITILRGMSILGALEGRMQRIPLRTKTPVETGTGVTGGWVAEGAAVPCKKPRSPRALKSTTNTASLCRCRKSCCGSRLPMPRRLSGAPCSGASRRHSTINSCCPPWPRRPVSIRHRSQTAAPK